MTISVDTAKPGRLYVTIGAELVAGRAYRVYAHRHGCLEIERTSDGATAFFQGDDAEKLRRAIARAEEAHHHPKSFMRAELAAYDAVLQPAEG